MSPFRGETGTGVCKKIEDTNYMHYTLQINVYAHLAEKNYFMKVERMAIAVFHPGNPNGGYIMYEVGRKARTARRICSRKK